ncbi:MAG: metallophosphoesterase [Clostridia bacterium]|nr:metallophosphoesterase [Clostridia bacterium]
MKKMLCVLLSLLTVFIPCSVCANAAEEDGMKVFVTSDTHWHDYGSVEPDGFYRPRADMGQMTALSPLILDRFLKDAAESDADFVFITGDLTEYGSDDAYDCARILADFEDGTGKQVFVVPGNHDIHLSGDPDDHLRFRRIYSRFGWDGALAVDEATSSYVAELKNGYRLLGINSNKANGGGVIGEDLLSWIEAQVKQAQADGAKLIAMMHHHIMEHFLLEQKIDDFYIIDNYKEVCRKFAEWNIRVTFTGHLHWGDIAEYQGRNKIYDVTTFSLPTYPLRYREVRFNGDEIALKSRTIDALDVTDIVSGYSDEQKEMIANDPVKYAKGCQTDSLSGDYIGRFVDPDYLIDMLGFAPDSVGAKAIKRIMPDVIIPLYGEGETAEAMAKELGYELPKSDYETVGELLSEFWAAMVRGDEDLGGSSPEGKLVLDAAYALFATKASQESPAVRALLNSRVIAVLGLKGIDNIFTRKAFDLILTGLTVDRAPADNDVTLPGYDADTGSFLYRAGDLFRKLLDLLGRLFALR